MKGAVTPEQVRAARAWASDCEWLDHDELDEMSDAEIVKGVDRHYDGGWEQFVKDEDTRPSKDHEHCRSIGRCWQEHYLCPTLARRPYLVPCEDCGARVGEPCVEGCPTYDKVGE